MTSLHAGPDIARMLELSDERDMALQLRLAAWREGFDAGRPCGYDEGWAAAEDAAERDHQELARRVLAIAHPDGPEAREDAARRVRTAEAGCRRDALDHWRKRWAELFALSRDVEFVREASMVEPLRRNYEQVMALLLRARQRGAA